MLDLFVETSLNVTRNFFAAKILWAQMEIMTFTWSDDLLDGDSPLSQQLKEEAEQAVSEPCQKS